MKNNKNMVVYFAANGKEGNALLFSGFYLKPDAISLTQIFPPKNYSAFHLFRYLIVYKPFAAERLGVRTFQR